MSHYITTARKWRPKNFCEVLGQEPIVTTLKNAIKQQRVAHAYLFCGSRGTGKTTLARVFAKALVCAHPNEDGEPCNQCSACNEITNGSSLDVLEIDGASHRGIDDIRQINETVGYASASGKYKIYIIDEVHMLTKEAFNALLKTLEEPPPKVVFFFATTEPHKVPPTILSRCQRFNLNRIPIEKIVAKLAAISAAMQIDIDETCLRIIAEHADGGLRDAESLFDQILAFHTGKIDAISVTDVLGIVPKNILFELDAAGKAGNYAMAFEIAEKVFSQGKDLVHFVEMLIEHYRNLLLIKCSGIDSPLLLLSPDDKHNYSTSACYYTQEMCLTNLDYLTDALGKIRFSPSSRVALESILLHLIKTHQRIPIEFLIRRLADLEAAIRSSGVAIDAPVNLLAQQQSQSAPQQQTQKLTPPISSQSIASTHCNEKKGNEDEKNEEKSELGSFSIDPTPSNADLGRKSTQRPQQQIQPAEQLQSQPQSQPQSLSLPQTDPSSPAPQQYKQQIAIQGDFLLPESPKPQTIDVQESRLLSPLNGDKLPPSSPEERRERQTRYQTILQFASVVFDGSLQIQSINLF